MNSTWEHIHGMQGIAITMYVHDDGVGHMGIGYSVSMVTCTSHDVVPCG